MRRKNIVRLSRAAPLPFHPPGEGVRNDRPENNLIPPAVKLNLFFASLPTIALRLAEAGAQGLVLFNRFYQPDFDPDELDVLPRLTLSTPQELPLPLEWAAWLYGHIPPDFVPARKRAGTRITDLRAWMEEHEYVSIEQRQRSTSRQALGGGSAGLEHANYMRVLSSCDFPG